MPRPRYIVCCQDRLIDENTHLVSHINVVDRLELRSFKLKDTAKNQRFVFPNFPVAKFVLTSVWLREEDDSEDSVFESEFLMHLPGGETESIARMDFSFKSRFHRFDVVISFTNKSKIKESGTLTLENRIRLQGHSDWDVSQSFPLDVALHEEEVSLPEDETKPQE